MNKCKPGDLAIVIKSPSGLNLGKIFKIIKPHGIHHSFFNKPLKEGEIVWEVDGIAKYRDCYGEIYEMPFYRDSFMQPLPDLDNEETKEKENVTTA